MRGASIGPFWPSRRSSAIAPMAFCRRCRLSAIKTATTVPMQMQMQRQGIQISSAPATEFPRRGLSGGDAFGAPPGDSERDDVDARFEVLGSPYSLLSVTLSASQILYTQRGTLVSVAGKVENATSTLSLLTPVRRALLGLPFLYQRVSSTTPLTLLIGTKAAHTTLITLHLDGTTDWVVAQRRALLAWTGHTLAIQPRAAALGGGLGSGLGLAHWGSSFVTGRGLVALAAPGYVYPMTLAAGEELVVHPSHVVAYAVGKNAPQPFRLKSAAATLANSSLGGAVSAVASSAASSLASVSTTVVKSLRLQTPASVAPVSRFWQVMRTTAAYTFAARTLFELRTILRRTIWGDRLFVHVRGPTTLLLSSRGVRMADVLTRDDVNEIADTESGVVPRAVATTTAAAEKMKGTKISADASTADVSPVAVHVATVKRDGKVEFTDATDLTEFVR